MGTTFGIEEEFLLVDRTTGELAPKAEEVLDEAHQLVGDQVTSELSRCQVESNSSTCTDLEQATAELTRLRSALAQAGGTVGVAPVALASHPWSGWQDQELNLEKEHYRALVNLYQDVARRQVICGCHIHVGVDDPEDRITVMNRVRPWLPVLLALSANSPWWQGSDTGYASYRTMIWREWPTAEVQPLLGDHSEFERLVGMLQQVGAIDTPSALYWYVRPSAQLPTVEYRVCDVSLRVEDAVTIAGLVRALTDTLLAQPADDLAATPAAVWETGIWRAARFGLEGELIEARSLTLVPAHEAVAQLLDLVDDALRAAGDHERVTTGVHAILRRGNGAMSQRGALGRFPDRSQALRAIEALGVLDDAQP